MTKALELRCECGGATKIIKNQPSDNGIRRERTCSRCGHTFVTYEVTAKSWKLLRDFERVLKKHL